MPGFVKLTDASTGQPFHQAIDLIFAFDDAATLKTSAPSGARTAIYAGKSERPSQRWPAYWVREEPETVQALIRAELRRVLSHDGLSGPQAP